MMQTQPEKQEAAPSVATEEKPVDKKKKEKEPKSVKMEVLSWIVTLLAAVVIAMLIRVFVFEPIRVDGTSMTNTLQDKEIVYTS